ncbi:hypothetical protein DFP74_1634 [Nocardiopsis sp. Huas11]|nr:hypothetical protein DFP74_1634 [Nocardiopsis sp. Huas11]
MRRHLQCEAELTCADGFIVTINIPEGSGTKYSVTGRGSCGTDYPRYRWNEASEGPWSKFATGLRPQAWRRVLRRQGAGGDRRVAPQVRRRGTPGGRSGSRPRTTPAGAGTGAGRRRPIRRTPGYLRGCGDEARLRVSQRHPAGLPPQTRGRGAGLPHGAVFGRTIPRVRGRVIDPVPFPRGTRTTPAGTGTSPMRPARPRSLPGYPRGCADERPVVPGPAHVGHYSRGCEVEPVSSATVAMSTGLYPSAGTRSSEPSPRVWARDYPRGCGDEAATVATMDRSGGLSPRARAGTRSCAPHPIRCRTEFPRGRGDVVGPPFDGTTPAGAGTRSGCATACDYPRGCGDECPTPTAPIFRQRTGIRSICPVLCGGRGNSCFSAKECASKSVLRCRAHHAPGHHPTGALIQAPSEGDAGAPGAQRRSSPSLRPKPHARHQEE